MKYAVVLVCLVAGVVAELPVAEEAQLSPQYGAPTASGYSASSGHARQHHQAGPSSQYGAPSGYSGGDQDEEPANYEFKYDVQDEESGVRFGHQEERQGDVAQGGYYVLLPDGRTQHVQYVADQDGFRPKITYEEPQGHSKGSSTGYPKGGPSSPGYSN